MNEKSITQELSEIDFNFHFRKFTGGTAENLAEFLLACSGYSCYKYGMEHNIHNLESKLKKRYDIDSNNRLRTHPDIMIIKDNISFLIEVKWKSKVNKRKVLMNFKEVENYQKYWNEAYILIITDSEPYFWILPIDKITNEMRLGFAKGTKAGELWDFSNIITPLDKFFEINKKALTIGKRIVPLLNQANIEKKNIID